MLDFINKQQIIKKTMIFSPISFKSTTKQPKPVEIK